ncbi:MAG: N-acetylneuraminate synthase [Lachnospiraceae bacterium]|nr:N-acetylneuraminate synthase [Lachnospiraceae bacterium]
MDRILIIAEAGVNHNGDLRLAKELALKAGEAGADIVKYQTFKPENLVTENADKAGYQKITTGEQGTQLDMLKKLALSDDAFRELYAYCKEIGIRFLSTAFDMDSIGFLHELGCETWKIPSGEITNLPYLRKIASYGQKVILSTGMATMEETGKAITVLKDGGTRDITVLHCTTAYPAPFDQINLRAMCTLEEQFHLPVGYSDHSRGIAIPCAAAALGARVIEKHFTLDRNMEGPDHKASLEPDELKQMTDAIRAIEAALGDGKKIPTELEIENSKVARKSIVARKAILKGEMLTEDNLTVKRPGTGLSPMLWDSVIGTHATKDFKADDLIWM